MRSIVLGVYIDMKPLFFNVPIWLMVSLQDEGP